MNRIIRENDDAKKAARKAAEAAKSAAEKAAKAAPYAAKAAVEKASSNPKGNGGKKVTIKDSIKAAKKSAKAAAKAAKAAAAPGSANESRKMVLRLTESDLHRIVKESVNRILREDYSKKNTLNLNESKTRKRAIKQAIEVGRRTIRGTVPDPIIERYVHEFTDKFMMGSPDYFYAYLPVLAEIAFRSKTRDEYTQVGEITMELSRLARMPEAREVIRGIRNANTVEDLEGILNDARNAAMRAE